MERDSTLERMAPPIPIATHEILGGGGVRLHAREWGNPEGPPIVFIHGWSQSDLCWLKQVHGDLARRFRIVTFDLRGHGLSEKPAGPEHYADGQAWADDLAAVIDQTGLERPILVAWSYGGYVVADYLRAYGDARIGGIDLVGAAVILSSDVRPRRAGIARERTGDVCSRPVREHRRDPAFPPRVHLQAARRRGAGCRVRVEHGRAVLRPRRVVLARARWQRCARGCLRSRARDARARRRDRAAVDGRTRAQRLPGRDSLVVRRRRPHAVLGGIRSLRPRAR